MTPQEHEAILRKLSPPATLDRLIATLTAIAWVADAGRQLNHLGTEPTMRALFLNIRNIARAAISEAKRSNDDEL